MTSRAAVKLRLLKSMHSNTILLRVLLGTQHKPTGKTRHYRGDQELSTPSELRRSTIGNALKEERGNHLKET